MQDGPATSWTMNDVNAVCTAIFDVDGFFDFLIAA